MSIDLNPRTWSPKRPANAALAARVVLGILIAWTADQALALPVPMTIQDFHLPGTQVGDVPLRSIDHSSDCGTCHGEYDPPTESYATWRGSLMGQAGRDPLFFAQMATANQDVANVGYYCMRCHVPLSFVTTHAYQPDGSTLDDLDRDGVNCQFCHSLVDPVYVPGVSPPEDDPILAALAEVPAFYADSMFVLDPAGGHRGARADAALPHRSVLSSFVQRGDMCGTCHDVGNVAVSRQPDGTYSYNALDTPTPDTNPWTQFPLERTYTEWRLSAFAAGGVDMGGRFGGAGATLVSTCQDCHMPKAAAALTSFTPVRPDARIHEFAGASAWVLEAIGLLHATDPEVDQAAILAGRAAATSMLQRAVSLALTPDEGLLQVRVVNESGHKIPTGHIEGRRIWANVRFFDPADALLAEYGAYDPGTAELDEFSTRIYEMHVALSPAAAAATGLPAGVTTHMALADTIAKDTRIPPRGFVNAAYEAGGAPVVGTTYADGQHWDDQSFRVPAGASRASVSVQYQTVTKHYIEALHQGNVTDAWGQTLYDLWLATNKGAPIEMATMDVALVPFVRGDFDADGDLDAADVAGFGSCFSGPGAGPVSGHCALGDFDGDGDVDCTDWILFVEAWPGAPAPTLAECSALPGEALNLRVARRITGELELAWDPSCIASDGEYAVQEGALGDWRSHLPVTCSTGGRTTFALTPAAASRYYLVVPRTAVAEGSYGADSFGAARPAAATPCLAQDAGVCQ